MIIDNGRGHRDVTVVCDKCRVASVRMSKAFFWTLRNNPECRRQLNGTPQIDVDGWRLTQHSLKYIPVAICWNCRDARPQHHAKKFREAVLLTKHRARVGL